MFRPVVLVAAAAALAALAQDQPISPVFRSGTQLVEVDVVVRNKKGPVTGLTKDDFTILDEGKARPIALFSVTDARNPAEPPVPLPPGAVSNRVNLKGETLSNATILLIDRLNTPIASQPYANRKVVEFLERNAGRDRIGIYTLGSTIRVVQDLTGDPDRLARAARSIDPQNVKRLSADVKTESTGDAVTDQMQARALEALEDIVVQDKAQTTRDAMIAIARHLAGIPGRKNLVWVSGSFPLLLQRAHYSINFSSDLDEASRALNDANVAVFPVDARGLAGVSANRAEEGAGAGGNCTGTGPCIPRQLLQQPDGLDTMNTLASLTGGRAFYNTNGIEDSIRRAADDAELTYTLGFYPAADAFDDRFHKLTVKVARKGIDLRYRQGYLAAKGPLASPADANTMTQLLRNPLDATEIGLTVQPTPDADHPGSYQLRIQVDLRDVHFDLQDGKWVGNLDIALGIPSARTFRSIARTIEVPEDQLAATLAQGFEVTNSMPVEGENPAIRVVARDRATGAAGSILVPVGR